MAYYKLNRNGRYSVQWSELSMDEFGESHKDELIGECDMFGNLRVAYVTPELRKALLRPSGRRAILQAIDQITPANTDVPQCDDIVTQTDLGLGKIDWDRIDVTPKYFGEVKQDLTPTGDIVETPIEVESMSKATDVKIDVKNGITRMTYQADGRLCSVVHGNGEYSMMSFPLEHLDTLRAIKGVKFRNSNVSPELEDMVGKVVLEIVPFTKLNAVNPKTLNSVIEVITTKVMSLQWMEIDWKRIIRDHSGLTVKEFIDVMNGKVEYAQGLKSDLTKEQAANIEALVQALQVWIITRTKSAFEVYREQVNTEATMDEFMATVMPPKQTLIDGGSLVEDPVAPVDTPKSLRKELLGKLDHIRNAAYRNLQIEQVLTQRRIFALEKQYATARSYLRKQLRALLVEGDTADNIYLDVAEFGTFRVLRKVGDSDWTTIAAVLLKDYNWIIEE